MKQTIRPWQSFLSGVVIIILGIVVLYLSMNKIKAYEEKNSTYIETTAMVKRYNTQYNSSGKELKAIVVEYYVGEELYRASSSTYKDEVEDIGTEVSIKYNPYNPTDVLWQDTSPSKSFLVFGGVAIFLGFISCIKGIIDKISGY